MPPVPCIFNPTAGGGRASHRWPALRETLARAGLNLDPQITSHPNDATRLARLLAPVHPFVVVAGGDGTVGAVADGVMGSGAATTLGLLPLGTGNDVARALGLRSLAHAVDVLQHGQPRAVDLIDVQFTGPDGLTARHAIQFASVGFATELLRCTPPHAKRWLGPRLAYVAGFLRALRHYRAPLMRVHAAHQRHDGHFFHVNAANTEWAGGGTMRLAPGARLDDGELDLCLIAPLNRWEALRHFPQLVRGTFLGHPKVRVLRATGLHVETDVPMPVQADGDVLGTTPATFSVRPRCLRVLGPPT